MREVWDSAAGVYHVKLDIDYVENNRINININAGGDIHVGGIGTQFKTFGATGKVDIPVRRRTAKSPINR
jgi:hypothetical protein